jgi:hypothetical protein
MFTHYASLTGHCSTCQARAPLTCHCSTSMHAPWEHASLKCTVEPAATSFMLEARAPQRALGRVAAPDPSSAGRRGPELWDTWQRRIPPLWGGGVWSRGTCGSTKALHDREARSKAIGHVTAPEPSPARRQDPEPQDTWQYRSPPQQKGEVRSCRTRGSTPCALP